ncbi:hypothetical protein CEE36_07410 [candidate division TA06 bacterium B3_TA06]|uniref:Potassium channel domain-containing protein n=1 Tax=candidate division TA06 bacterium B3_TA06 TaxID=2012487 RepID=A0A532V4B2_UNCT6|nr:MAG: hypothetical protein CEE36_07410 [candidate division TA06 bacterium B3_TA06]
MAKSKGRKPVTPLPDPKELKKCKHEGCEEYAVFFEDYCWEHLSKKAKSKYKAKIEDWVKKGRSLEGANLEEVDLSYLDLRLLNCNMKNVNLSKANLTKTLLWGANLEGAELEGAKLIETEFCRANLKEAILEEANLQDANLYGANLQNAYLGDASLQNAYLMGANLRGAIFDGADLEGVWICSAILDSSTYLSWNQIRIVGTEKMNWGQAEEDYLLLKNYFHQRGRYEDEGKAYYREKLMAKHQAHEELFGKSTSKGFKRAFQNIGRFFVHNENKGVRRRWLGLWFMWALAGFGERWIRTIFWALGTFVFFGLLHWLGTNATWWSLVSRGGEIKHLLDCLYFSLVTFVTLGFGDIWPEAWATKILVGVEVVLGYVFLGMIVTLIARKMGR